jgi:hypothetical protein
MAWRSSHNMSRLRMLELFSRVTGSGGGTGEAPLFNGLRVRMVGDLQRHGLVCDLTGVIAGTACETTGPVHFQARWGSSEQCWFVIVFVISMFCRHSRWARVSRE